MIDRWSGHELLYESDFPLDLRICEESDPNFPNFLVNYWHIDREH